jgi:4'-phosphopantetheinyl transferase
MSSWVFKSEWSRGGRNLVLSLGYDEVLVWFFRPDIVEDRHLAAFGQVLDDAERARAGRFHFPADSRSYRCAHALGRCVLQAATGVQARDIRFRDNAHGKPELDGEPGVSGLRFNLSHTRGLVCCGITRNRDLGVDVECVSRDVDIDDLARRVFAPEEVVSLQGLGEEARCEAFYSIWVLKEAYTKAVGRGLSIPLDGFSIRLDPPCIEIGALLRGDPDAGSTDEWDVRLMHPVPGYVLAAAVRAAPGDGMLYRFCEMTPDALASLCGDPDRAEGGLPILDGGQDILPNMHGG